MQAAATMPLNAGVGLYTQVLRVVGILVGLVLTAYLLLCGFFFVEQRSFLYFPVPARKVMTTITLPNNDLNVRVSVAHTDNDTALVYFGGNAEDVSVTVDEMGRRFPDMALYALHYRGYGASEGRPSEKALVSDAKILLDLVMKAHRNVRVVGRSLGSGVAVQSAAGRRIESLTLVTPYGSIEEIASRLFWFLPVSILIRDSYKTTEHVGRLDGQVNIIVAERDRVIPWWSIRSLVDSFPATTKVNVVIAKGRGHNDVQHDPRYWRVLGGGAGANSPRD